MVGLVFGGQVIRAIILSPSAVAGIGADRGTAEPEDTKHDAKSR
jgi:hypothetical protein